MDVPRDINYVALPSTSSEVVTATAAAAASSRRRKILVIGSATSVLLVLALLGAALYLSPPMQKKGDNNAGGGENVFLSRDNARLEPAAVSRGPSEGVSEKMSAVRYGDGGDDANGGGGFPWSNSMLQWQRTGFHFQPEKNWMNDPNGPVYYKGWYHLFYQYNPDAAVWGNITWGHAVSHDLVHWYHLPLAMVRDQWYDYNGVWTGSATVSSSGQVYMLYTGSTNASVQVQNLAFPADPSDALLINWTKYEGNPVLTPPSNLLPTDFRDPTTAWFDNSDGTWRIAIGSKDDSHAGITLVYKTKDFISYELVPGILHKVANTGMWECVDFFAVAASSSSANQAIDTTVLAAMGNGQDDIRHVLKASMDDDRHDYYAIGRYDAINNKWKPDNAEIDVGIGLRYDWGIFYAAKTFFDPVKQRRILWGWIGETDSERSDVRKGWASLMSIPRTVLFDIKTKSNLLQWPVEEVEKLRMNSTTFTDVTIDTASYYRLSATRAAQLDIVAEFEIKNTTLEKAVESDEEYSCTTSRGAADRGLLGPFGFLVLADKSLSEQTAVYFYVSRNSDGSLKTHFCQDETRSSKATDIIKKVVGNVVPVLSGETLTVRILVDHSIVEGFAQGGRTCITSRVYPTKAIDDAAGVYLFNNATAGPITAKSVTIWEMSSSYNRAYNGNDGDA